MTTVTQMFNDEHRDKREREKKRSNMNKFDIRMGIFTLKEMLN